MSHTLIGLSTFGAMHLMFSPDCFILGSAADFSHLVVPPIRICRERGWWELAIAVEQAYRRASLPLS
jgi:hypothetical protein